MRAGHALPRDGGRGGLRRDGVGGAVALTVRDTGQGMDERRAPRRSSRFSPPRPRAAAAASACPWCTASCSRAAARSRWRASRGTARRSASCFPRRRPARRGEEGKTAAPPPGAGDGLVVEDEASIRSLACEMLEALGYRALEASSAEEGLASPRLRRPDPPPGDRRRHARLAGPASRTLHRPAPDTRVLYMSGYAGTTSPPRRGRRRRAPGAKPFTADVLGRRVREALDR